MPLPQALQDFFDMLSDPDIEGYDTDTSLSLSKSDMPPGLMTPSDDLIVNPAYWRANPEQEHLMRQQLNESFNRCSSSVALEADLTITILPQTFDTGSVTESESDPTTPTTAHTPPRPYQDDPITPAPVPVPPCPYQVDTGSTTESESETDSLLDGYFVI
ncbi:hypothetical protein BDR05DRAFT_1005945 [Suillus weaverae]|nr:hypothetical protein BDR05DRAFT_1005945 [Suillus weaverae]